MSSQPPGEPEKPGTEPEKKADQEQGMTVAQEKPIEAKRAAAAAAEAAVEAAVEAEAAAKVAAAKVGVAAAKAVIAEAAVAAAPAESEAEEEELEAAAAFTRKVPSKEAQPLKSSMKKPKESPADQAQPQVTVQPSVKTVKFDSSTQPDENSESLDPLRAASATSATRQTSTAATETTFEERHTQMQTSESEERRRMTSGFNNSRATQQTGFPGRVAATADSNEQTIKGSYERIKQNIADAAIGKRLEETQLYQDTKVKIIRDDHNNLKLSMEYENGKVDEISRAINHTTHQMTAVLSRNAEDKSFLLFCDINKEFQPLHMKPCNDVQIVLKVFEASVKMGVKIEISEGDKALLNNPENAALKTHFDLLTNEPAKFKEMAEVAGVNRKLGQPFAQPLQFTSGPSSTSP